MAEQSTTNSIYPQDGNQIVIGENHATITINNYAKEKSDIKNLSEQINESFAQMQRYFRENQFSIRKKRKSK